MPRYERKISESGFYHIIIRGNERRKIFLEDNDKAHFIKKMTLKAEETNITIIAYVLMDNHVHLLLLDNDLKISEYMKKINISYVVYFNKKYNRIGHLFQDRFKSEAIEDDNFLLSVVRYIHRNPIKANMVSDICNYKWSSYNAYLNNDNSIVKTDLILEMLSEYNKNVINEFIAFHKEEGSEVFIENDELSVNDRRKIVENEAKKIIDNLLKKYSININDLKLKENKELRNEIIKKIVDNVIISERQIAKLMNIDKGTVNKSIKQFNQYRPC